ncbi:hypothetical protein LUZ60_004977 [Juncus effusus]|nr:hypothetical protein LUZ60_004977 [Juncus effusus]
MDLRSSISTQTTFSLRLAHHLIASSATNLVFSPLSLHAALSLVAAGAKGATLAQILSVLNSDSIKSVSDLGKLAAEIVDLVLADGSGSGGPKLVFANGVWFDQSLKLKDGFKEIVTKDYKAETKSVDFLTKANEAASEVNSWAEKATNGLIKNLLEPGSVDQTTRLVLSNALYFKGSWTEKFDQSKTQNSDFHLLDDTKIQVPFMTSSKKQFVSSFNDFSVLKMPYCQGTDKRQFSMYIFLPHSKSGISIPGLTEKMFTVPDFLNRHNPTKKISLEKFKIPKFKISYGFEGSAILKKLGLELPFSQNAELTEMIDSSVGNNLCVSSVFHKSFVEVNEEGTEAAAASAAVVVLRAIFMEQKEEFVADRPFVFVIKEEMTGVVLFVGQVLDPSVE